MTKEQKKNCHFMPRNSIMHGATTHAYKVRDVLEYYLESCFLVKSFVRMVEQLF